ncbi:MAG: hypothetical protein KatS3mg114_1012 [Planctomycetaceae bacterium]|nr:MAG: hypothetical protein KatS3mg114_1012 [Planctomycetaceae bacterium]
MSTLISSYVVPVPPSKVSSRERSHGGNWWALLFILHFFLPYLPGTRYRIEVFTLLLGLLFPLGRTWSATVYETDLLLMSGLSACWSLMRIGLQPHPEGLAPSAIQWINLNFPFLATCFYLLLRSRLQRHRYELVPILLLVGLINNLIAGVQYAYPDWPYHQLIYRLYGGTISEGYDTLALQTGQGEMTNAEFLARMGGRYTGLLATSHMLSVFNVWLIGLAWAYMERSEATRSQTLLGWLAILSGLWGGVLSGGKMFYLGVIVTFTILLLLKRQFTLLLWGGLMAAGLFTIGLQFLGEDHAVRLEIQRLFAGDWQSLIETRFAADGYLRETFEALLTDGSLLWWGTGADLGSLVAADNLFLLPILTGGVPQLVLYVLPFVWLLRWLWQLMAREPSYCPMLYSLHLSFLISGIGVPVYQMGRLAPLMWILTLCLMYPAPIPRGSRYSDRKTSPSWEELGIRRVRNNTPVGPEHKG